MDRQYENRVTGAAAWTQVDMGLRKYMLQVYNFMAMGLGLTGVVAYFVGTSPTLINAIFGTPLCWVVMIAPVALAWTLSARIRTMRFSSAQTLFWIYAATVGLSLSILVAVYEVESVVKTFFITASLFGGMSLYGYTTNKDLTQWGSFLMMGVFGIVIAGLVNLFTQSSGFQTMISFIAVIVFTGLTAYDVQNIKATYYDLDDEDTIGKKAIFGALHLYLDFINLFVHLLRLIGDRRD